MNPATGRDGMFSLGCFPFRCGRTLPDARLAYRVFGELNEQRSNLVLYPSSYGAWPEDLDWAIGPILDPRRWCVVLVSQFGNGRSSSPGHAPMGLAEDGWVLSHVDNLNAQRSLLEEVFRVESPALIYGWSMGAQQALHWAVLEPERCQRVLAICGTARTTPHNRLFLLSLRRALTGDPSWDGRRFRSTPESGLLCFATIYASWACSQPYFRSLDLQKAGFDSIEAYVEGVWLPAYSRHDPHNLLSMLDTWLANDVTAAAGCPGDLAAALGRIRARTTLLAGRHDLYFPPEDMAAEAALISGSRFGLIHSELGHRAGNPRDAPAEQAVIRQALDDLCTDLPPRPHR
ncbi:MAG: alpha/beta fold hydrolase [Cyanobacteriota bacterium]|nr:alpha/beta fold hydrolase [Cyanobacteriota bacterium]